MSKGNGEEVGHDHDHGAADFRCENRDSCSKAICDKDRRRILGALAAGGSLSLAGCTGLFASPQATGGTTGSQRQFDVEYTQEGETLEVGDSQTILGAGLDAGLELDYDCKAGFCGACLSRTNGDASDLVRMVVNDVDLLTDEAVEDGYFLPCTSNPETSLKVDTSASTGDLLEYQEEEEDEGEGSDGDGDGSDGDGSDGEDENGDEGGQTFYQVAYTNEQWSIAVPEDQSLLEAGEDVGLDLPFQCRVGNCGQCLARTDGDAGEVVEMEANNYDPLDDDAISDGYFLTCTGFARDDFELESNQYGEI